MAAVGAPEVITQLESAAKVLMVRNSSLLYSYGAEGTCVSTLSRVELGGRGLPLVFVSSRFLLLNVFSFFPLFTGGTMRGAKISQKSALNS